MSGKARAGSRNYAGIDYFRLLAAVMVIAIHTAPFSGISGTLDLLVTYCAGRVAVPFFFMTTGYFVLGTWKAEGCMKDAGISRFLKKTLFLYAAAVVLYLPVNFYSDNLPQSIPDLLRKIIFDGTFYHLWYFPAVALGCILTVVLLKRRRAQSVMAAAVLLYLIGAGGDSYYGLVSRIPVLKAVYGVLFTVSSYTRNGIFYAPLFLMLGMMIREKSGERGRICRNPERSGTEGRNKKAETDRAPVYGLRAGLCCSTVLLLAEGYLTYSYGLQRHNSMYLFLIPVMYFLFRLLLTVPGNAPGWTRDVSMLVYIMHPAVLIALRGFAGAAGLTGLLVDNTFMQFLSVTAASFLLALFLHMMYSRVKRRKEAHENA